MTVTIQSITPTTAGESFTLGQGGVLNIEFAPQLAEEVKASLPKYSDFYLVTFSDKYLFVPSDRFKALYTYTPTTTPDTPQTPSETIIEPTNDKPADDTTPHEPTEGA